MAKRKKKKIKLNSRFILFFSILAIVIMIIAFGNKVSGGSLLRIVYLIGDGISGTADEVTIQFDSNNANRFHPIKGGFAVLSIDGMHIYSLNGEEKSFTPLSYHSPSLTGGENALVAYDRNGQQYTVMSKNKVIANTNTLAPIINISMNEKGAFTVVTAGPDCKALVTAYDKDLTERYKLHSTEQYILSAPISEDGDYMATLGFSAATGQFAGRITFYKTDEENAFKSTDLPDCMPIAARFMKNGDLVVICEDKMLRFNDDCDLICEIPFHGQSIDNASLQSRNIGSVLLLGGGNASQLLVSVKKDQRLEFNFSETIYDISSAGKYTALLLSDRIVVYNSDGEEHHTFKLTQGIKECIMRSDGTVFAIGRNFANLLIP